MGDSARRNGKKRAVVIGASSEIGAAVVGRLLRDGFDSVCATGFSRSQNSTPFVSTRPNSVHWDKIDLTFPENLDRYFQDLSRIDPALDALVYAAGTGGTRKSFADTGPGELQSIFQINILSAIRAFQCALPLLTAGRGSAVFVGSKAGLTGGRRLAAYAASKAALHQWVISAARECASSGVRINAVAPGAVDTTAMRTANDLSDDQEVSAFGTAIPMGRTGTPEEVSDTIAWLLSDAASYVTGTVVPITGGL